MHSPCLNGGRQARPQFAARHIGARPWEEVPSLSGVCRCHVFTMDLPLRLIGKNDIANQNEGFSGRPVNRGATQGGQGFQRFGGAFMREAPHLRFVHRHRFELHRQCIRDIDEDIGDERRRQIGCVPVGLRQCFVCEDRSGVRRLMRSAATIAERNVI